MGDRANSGEERRREEAQYVCEACGESFDSEAELREHLYAVGLVE
ncbi:C2H2-type zinc finger protein [Halorussus sp. AFM4]